MSVYEDDDEALALWRDHIGVPVERIRRMGAADNFWASGPTGMRPGGGAEWGARVGTAAVQGKHPAPEAHNTAWHRTLHPAPLLAGPCGPCSELYYDFHPERGYAPEATLEDDSRFIEFYNLVFMEMNRCQVSARF